MLLPDGTAVRVFWAEYELIWVRAAITLPLQERQEAYREIAALSGRALSSVEAKAVYEKKRAAEASRLLLMESFPRRVMVPGRSKIYGQRR